MEIGFANDVTNAQEKTRGSDGRLNVSSRTDNRMYYNSRDESQAFTVVWDDADSEAGDYVVSWKNTTATGKTLVIEGIGVNAIQASSFKLAKVTGTAVGVAVTPFCLNQAVPLTASATCVEAAGTAITGLTEEAVIDHAGCTATGHEEFRLRDGLRIGPAQTIAIEYERGTTGRTWGVIFGYYE